MSNLDVLEKLRYNFRISSNTNEKFKAAFIHIGEIVFIRSRTLKTTSSQLGSKAGHVKAVAYSAELHADTFLQAEQLNIMNDVLLDSTKKTMRGELIAAAVQMMEDALSTIGDFDFVLAEGDDTSSNYLRRVTIAFEKIDGIVIDVPESRNRNAALCKISKL